MKIPKRSHESVNYRDAENEGKRCDTCVMWRPPDSCTDVQDPIRADGVCNIWYGGGGSCETP